MKIRLLTILIMMAAITKSGWSRPVDLSAPQEHFDYVSNEGYLHLWREFGQIDFGDGLSLPLRLDFASERQTPSPYVGRYWRCALLESKGFLKDESHLQVTLLCGKVLYFKRDDTNKNLFHSYDDEWTAETLPDGFKIYRDDGWELDYAQGRLQRLTTDQKRTLVWNYSGGEVASVSDADNSNNTLTLGFNADHTLINSIEFNGKQYQFNYSGSNLASVNLPNGKTESYKLDETRKDVASLTVADPSGAPPTQFTWNQATRQILSDGLWNYTLGKINNTPAKPGNPEPQNVTINRVDKSGKKESYYYDPKSGIATFMDVTGSILKTYRIKTPGPLYGEIRKRERIVKGVTTTLYTADFYDDGRLLRTINDKGVVTSYVYDDKGNSTATSIQDGQVLSKKETHGDDSASFFNFKTNETSSSYAKSLWSQDSSLLGKLAATRQDLIKQAVMLIILKRGDQVIMRALEDIHHRTLARVLNEDHLEETVTDKQTRTTYVDGVKSREETLDAVTDKPVERTLYSPNSLNPISTETLTYDDKGRLQKIVRSTQGKISTTQIAYDDQGRVSLFSNSLSGTYQYVYLPDGERKQHFIPPNPQVATQNSH